MISSLTVVKNIPGISVIIPVLNGAKNIRKCLDSIHKQNYPLHLIDVTIVDNHSSDETVSIIKNNFPKVKIIQLERNIGSAPALTLAAKQIMGDFILATNDDVIFDKNCFKGLIDLANSDPIIGITTGKMLYLKPPHKLAVPGFRINHFLGYHPYDLTHSNSIRECDTAPGACILIRSYLLKKLGYFDNSYIFCGEDHDICFQVKKAGYKVMYTPRAIFYHGFTRNLSIENKSEDIFFAHYRGKIRYIIKNLPFYKLLSSLFFQIAIGPIFTYIKFKNRTFTPLFKALLWNWRELPKTLFARKQAQLTTKKIIRYFPQTKNQNYKLSCLFCYLVTRNILLIIQ